MKLNPLIKIENVNSEECIVKLLIDRKEYGINRDLFLSFLDIYQNNLPRAEIESLLLEKFHTGQIVVSKFIDELLKKKILLENTKGYPVDQIEHWAKRNWLSALIYHLESQNITCDDDGSKKGEDFKKYNFDNKVESNIWKLYPDAPTETLPPPDLSVFESVSFEDVLLKRNSFSPFRKKPILLQDFSNILAAANLDLRNNRLNLEKSSKHFYKSSFVALETYVFVLSVSGLEKGLYHYDPKTHALASLEKKDFESDIVDMCIGQRRSAAGGCLFLFVANTERYMVRYKHERAYRNLLVNTAEFAHQYIFYSTALDYNTFLTPAIQDDFASKLLKIDGFKEMPLYTVTIG